MRTLRLLLPAAAQEAQRAEPPKQTEGVSEVFLKTVVSIEVAVEKDKTKPIGTGFLVSHPSGLIALVTAKHVVSDKTGKLKSRLAYRLNSKNGDSLLFNDAGVTKVAGPWFLSEKHDVAFRFIVLAKDRSEIGTFATDMILSTDQVRPGAPILIAGFPLGLRSEEHAVPILRGGIVARVGDGSLIVDGFTFPGNSGGPVMYVPTLKVGKGLKVPFINRERLLGLVTQQISYTEKAVSPQSGRARITFEDNSGLSIVVPASRILDLFARADVTKLVDKLRPKQDKEDEQDGADQPATAPESKPESKEKPKPESEGRSQ